MDTNNIDRPSFTNIITALNQLTLKYSDNETLQQELISITEMVDVEMKKNDKVKQLAYELASKI